MSGTSDFKSQSEGGAGGGEGGLAGAKTGEWKSHRGLKCVTQGQRQGRPASDLFIRLISQIKSESEHRRRSLKGERRAGRCNPGSLTLIDRKEWKEIFQLKANVTAKGPACNIQRHLIKNNNGVCMNVFAWK